MLVTTLLSTTFLFAENNFAILSSNGDSNHVEIEQKGKNGVAALAIASGNHNGSAFTGEDGSKGSLHITQTGDIQQNAVMTIKGNYNQQVYIEQTNNSGAVALLALDGNYNSSVSITQNGGENHHSDVKVFGNYNQAKVEQYGGVNNRANLFVDNINVPTRDVNIDNRIYQTYTDNNSAYMEIVGSYNQSNAVGIANGDSRDNIASMIINGTNNQGNLIQMHSVSKSIAKLTITGNDNNYNSIYQGNGGASDTAEISITGNENSTKIFQNQLKGISHTKATVDIEGNTNSVYTNQQGSFNISNVIIRGNNNHASTLQLSQNNKAAISITGNGTNAKIHQKNTTP